MSNVKRFIASLLLLPSLCSVSFADAALVEQPTSAKLEAHLEFTAQKLEEMQKQLEAQERAYEAVFLSYERSIKTLKAENEILSRKYVISRNVTLVVTTALLATILVCSLKDNHQN